MYGILSVIKYNKRHINSWVITLLVMVALLLCTFTVGEKISYDGNNTNHLTYLMRLNDLGEIIPLATVKMLDQKDLVLTKSNAGQSV